MFLTPLGKDVISSTAQNKQNVAYRLINGQDDIDNYLSGFICYDAVAFVRYLQYFTPPISVDELINTYSQAWLPQFSFETGIKWHGEYLMPGLAVGFKRKLSNNNSYFFHAAISVGNKSIRGVNGLYLGPNWPYLADLNILKGPDQQGFFTYDNALVEVYISRAF